MLLAYNKTASPITLSGLAPIIPASAAPPARGAAVNVTTELRSLSGAQYTALEAQRLTSLVYVWTGEAEFDTGTLVVLPTSAIKLAGGSMVREVRGASLANVADLTAFTLIDTRTGVTYAEKDRVLLCQQTTGAANPYLGSVENGEYVVGVPNGGGLTAPLTRAPDYTADVAMHSTIRVQEGYGCAGTLLAVNNSLTVQVGAIVIGTTKIRYAAMFSTRTAKKMKARGASFVNVADLTAVSTTQDGLTMVAGQTFALLAQTTQTENGLYVFGSGTGTCQISRCLECQVGDVTNFGDEITIMAGTIGTGRVYRLPISTSTVGNASLPFTNHIQKGTATLSSGTVTVAAFLTSTSTIILTRRDAGGTTTLTILYGAPVATRVVGSNGAIGSFDILAEVAAGTINSADNSTVDWMIVDGSH